MEKAKKEDKNLSEVVRDRICKFLGERNLTQYRLAKISNVPLPTIKGIMQRRTKGIQLKTIILLAHGLGMTPSEFIDDPSFLAENLTLD